MFKFIGVVTVLGVIALCVGVWFGYADFSTHAQITKKGEQTISNIRHRAADEIRGK